jgi:hypothetical protein
MRIKVWNQSDIPGDLLKQALQAVQDQVNFDVFPYWGVVVYELSTDLALEDTDAEITISSEPRSENNLGEHWADDTHPKAWVYVAGARDLGDWTITLSHEVLEMVVNPLINRYVPVPGSHIEGWEFYAYFVAQEICDPVTNNAYTRDEIKLSDFVLPSWFTPDQGDEPNSYMEHEFGSDYRAESLTPREDGFLLYIRGCDGQQHVRNGALAPSWAVNHLAWRKIVHDPASLNRIRTERAAAPRPNPESARNQPSSTRPVAGSVRPQPGVIRINPPTNRPKPKPVRPAPR